MTSKLMNQGRLYLQYVKENGGWKLLTIWIGHYTLHRNTVPELIGICQDLLVEKPMTATMYCLAAGKMMKPAKFLQYRKESDYLETIQTVRKKIGKHYNFPFLLNNPSQTQVISANVHISPGEGIAPIIGYITQHELPMEKLIKQEAREVYPEILKVFPSLEDSFSYIVLQAFTEPPTDPKKYYQWYKTVFHEGQLILPKD